MKIKKFWYEKSPGDKKLRDLLVHKETDTYFEGLDLQDLGLEDFISLDRDLKKAEVEIQKIYDEIIESYDLNMFKRFLKSKIVGTIS